MIPILTFVDTAAFCRRFVLFSSILTLSLGFGKLSAAQTASAWPYSPEADSDSTTSAPDVPSDSNSRGETDSNLALSASQIISVMQQNPEVIVELKSQLADASQQKGTPLQPDAITDEMLYAQIASNSDLRASITVFLRARGYIADSEIQRSGSSLEPSQASGSRIENQSNNELPLGASPNQRLLNPDAVDRGLIMPGAQRVQERSKELQEVSGRQSNREKQVHTITDQPQVLRRPTPYNLQSMRDLYVQVPTFAEPLKRFGSDVFVTRDSASSTRAGLASSSPPLDIPVRPDYVVGPGDSLTINLWGGVTETLNRVIDREGRVMLPETGEVQVAGLTLESAQAVIEGALKPQFRNAHVAITVSRLRTVRIYVVGDVQRPGAYDISSLSSPLGALYAAGGPTAIGSLRVLQHLRDGKQIGEVDLYDFLLHGVQHLDDRLVDGDTLLVPAAGPQVAVSGAVKRPAIYELLHEKTLAALLAEAGGATAAAALGHITIERIDANQKRQTVSLDTSSSDTPDAQRAAIATFEVKDGDRVWVAPILPQSERVIYIEGHVVRPGRRAYRDGMRLDDVLQSYQDLLPEPAARAEIVRLVPPDLHAETIDFNVPDALIGNANLPLYPFDTIRIFGRYEQDPPDVSVRGEVIRPGTYALPKGMTAAQLVRMAGGFKRDALLADADLISYQVVNGEKIVGERRDLRIGDAVLKGDQEADAALKPGDVLTVHQITGWDDIGASIIIEGEIAHPGSYGFQEGEHLSDILRRAGGFRETAYPEGAVLTRPEVQTLEEKSREELIRQIETSSAAARLAPNVASGDQSATLQLIQQQQQEVLSRLRSQPASGRLVIHVTASIDSWAGTAADIEVRSGDQLRIPKRPGFVLITGQVYNSSAITFVPGKSAGWYLQRAGGATEVANRKDIFIIRANGSVIGRRSGDWYDRDVLSTRLDPGDVIVVPQKIVGASLWWRNLISTAQIAASIAITAAVAGL
jgi:protein involved in polysaccharide export with SLBB domain